jgi:hypothetical protein
MVARGARMNTVMVSARQGDSRVRQSSSRARRVYVCIATKATNGRYEEVEVPSRLGMLLGGWGKDLAALHTRQSIQFRVTVERGNSGDLKNPRIELARAGATGVVTRDGYLP